MTTRNEGEDDDTFQWRSLKECYDELVAAQDDIMRETRPRSTWPSDRSAGGAARSDIVGYRWMGMRGD
jgi:hypothetical protein